MAEIGVGLAETFVPERPRERSGAADGPAPVGGAVLTDRVTVDDGAALLARFASGVTGTFEASRLAPGRKAYESFEINGSVGVMLLAAALCNTYIRARATKER